MTSNDRDPLRAALEALPRNIEPARDLWPDIAARIAIGKGRSPYARWSIAAAVLIALAVVLGTALRGPRPGNHLEVNAPAARAAAEPLYFAARARFAEAAVRESTRLTPETQAVLLRNLRIIETSMADIQQTLDKEPGNFELHGLLFQLYRDEADLLNAAQRVQLQTTSRTML